MSISYTRVEYPGGGGGDLTLTWYTYRYVPAFWGVFPTKFSIGIGRFSSETKSGVI